MQSDDTTSIRHIHSTASNLPNRKQEELSVPPAFDIDQAPADQDESEGNDDDAESIGDLPSLPSLPRLVADALRKFFIKALPIRVSVHGGITLDQD